MRYIVCKYFSHSVDCVFHIRAVYRFWNWCCCFGSDCFLIYSCYAYATYMMFTIPGHLFLFNHLRLLFFFSFWILGECLKFTVTLIVSKLHGFSESLQGIFEIQISYFPPRPTQPKSPILDPILYIYIFKYPPILLWLSKFRTTVLFH